MRKRGEVQKGFLLTVVVLLAVAIFASYFNDASGYATQSRPSQTSSRTSASGTDALMTEEHVWGTPKNLRCSWWASGRFTCQDKNGVPTPYHCGDEFEAEGYDRDTHIPPLCDVQEIHMPNALMEAWDDVVNACTSLARIGCTEAKLTGSFVKGQCRIRRNSELRGYSVTIADAEVYAKCMQPSAS